MRDPEPFFRAGALVAAAEISNDPTGVPWLREALDQFTWGGWERAAARVRQLLRAAGAPVPGHGGQPRRFPRPSESWVSPAERPTPWPSSPPG
jgi:hypothetical protein